MMYKTLLIGVAAIAIAAPAAAANLVNNGGFESGNFAGWSQFGDTSFTGVADASAGFAEPPPEGAFYAFFGPTAGVGGIQQTLATTIGQQYRISYFLSGVGGEPNSFQAGFGGTIIENIVNSGGFLYSLGSFTATATSDLTVLSFSMTHPPGFWLIDGVSVTAINGAVPEPASWAMLIAGFGLVGAVARRRRAAIA